MRADAHYVDQLVAPAPRRADDEARTPLPPPKATATTSPIRTESAVLNEEELAKSLSAVLSCTDLVVDGMPRLTRAVALDMIRAEAQRTICALRAAHVLKHGVPAERRKLDARAVMERVVDTVGPETRLRGSRVSVASDAGDALEIRADETGLVMALSSVVVMLSMGLHDVQGARLDLKVSGGDSGRVTFAIAQESVILPDSYLKIASAPDAMGTPETAPLLALRHFADAYGGGVAVTRLPHGTQVSLELPAAAA